MTTLYFITLPNKIFNVRIKDKSCIVGIPHTALANKVQKALHKRGDIGSRVAEVDYFNNDFYKMLSLNQLDIMIATEIKFFVDHMEIDGDIIDCPDASSDDLVDHLEKLYVQNYPEY